MINQFFKMIKFEFLEKIVSLGNVLLHKVRFYQIDDNSEVKK